jgi:chromosomal replication initiation ATPase DnaA
MTRAAAGTRRRLADVVRVVAAATGLRPEQLSGRRKGSPSVVRGRQIAMYLALVVLELPREAIAAYFGRHRTTVGHAAHIIEDLRDLSRFDDWLSELELRIRSDAWDASPGDARSRNERPTVAGHQMPQV